MVASGTTSIHCPDSMNDLMPIALSQAFSYKIYTRADTMFYVNDLLELYNYRALHIVQTQASI